MNWLGVIIVGMTIGLLGSLISPRSSQETPMWLSVACGVAGMLVGWAVVGEGHPVLRWVASLLVAFVLVAGALVSGERDRERV